MILIPELETVVILVPRTGTTSIRKAVARRYPESMLLYRHMEADGVPAGYDRWRKVGLVRPPVDRMWSLYHYMRRFGGAYGADYIQRIRASCQCSFEDWLLHNDTVFTDPRNNYAADDFIPKYMVKHVVPENRKSQWLYLRPDLGTEVYAFEDMERFAREFDLELTPCNGSGTKGEAPPLSPEAQEHINLWFGWDLAEHERLTYR